MRRDQSPEAGTPNMKIEEAPLFLGLESLQAPSGFSRLISRLTHSVAGFFRSGRAMEGNKTEEPAGSVTDGPGITDKQRKFFFENPILIDHVAELQPVLAIFDLNRDDNGIWEADAFFRQAQISILFDHSVVSTSITAQESAGSRQLLASIHEAACMTQKALRSPNLRIQLHAEPGYDPESDRPQGLEAFLFQSPLSPLDLKTHFVFIGCLTELLRMSALERPEPDDFVRQRISLIFKGVGEILQATKKYPCFQISVPIIGDRAAIHAMLSNAEKKTGSV